MAEKIAGGAPLAVSYMKKILNKSYHNLEKFLDEEALVQTFCLGTYGNLFFKKGLSVITVFNTILIFL